MKRAELEHVLRAAAAISHEQSFVVVGSQAGLLERIGQIDGKYPVADIQAWARRHSQGLTP